MAVAVNPFPRVTIFSGGTSKVNVSPTPSVTDTGAEADESSAIAMKNTDDIIVSAAMSATVARLFFAMYVQYDR